MGWIPDIPDHRDLHMTFSTTKEAPKEIKKSLDFRSTQLSVIDPTQPFVKVAKKTNRPSSSSGDTWGYLRREKQNAHLKSRNSFRQQTIRKSAETQKSPLPSHHCQVTQEERGIQGGSGSASAERWLPHLQPGPLGQLYGKCLGSCLSLHPAQAALGWVAAFHLFLTMKIEQQQGKST